MFCAVGDHHESKDDFRVDDEGFVAAMSGDPDFVTHTWPGGHEAAYWVEHWPDYQRFHAKALANRGRD